MFLTFIGFSVVFVVGVWYLGELKYHFCRITNKRLLLGKWMSKEPLFEAIRMVGI
jgi:hypothetical protein